MNQQRQEVDTWLLRKGANRRKWEGPLAGVMFALKQGKAVFMMVVQFSEFTEHQRIVCTLSVDELGAV